jgi:hypothetical protein
MVIRKHTYPEERFIVLKIETRIAISRLIWLILIKNDCQSNFNLTREKKVQGEPERVETQHCEYRNSVLTVAGFHWAVVLSYLKHPRERRL